MRTDHHDDLRHLATRANEHDISDRNVNVPTTFSQYCYQYCVSRHVRASIISLPCAYTLAEISSERARAGSALGVRRNVRPELQRQLQDDEAFLANAFLDGVTIQQFFPHIFQVQRRPKLRVYCVGCVPLALLRYMASQRFERFPRARKAAGKGSEGDDRFLTAGVAYPCADHCEASRHALGI